MEQTKVFAILEIPSIKFKYCYIFCDKSKFFETFNIITYSKLPQTRIITLINDISKNISFWNLFIEKFNNEEVNKIIDVNEEYFNVEYEYDTIDTTLSRIALNLKIEIERMK